MGLLSARQRVNSKSCLESPTSRCPCAVTDMGPASQLARSRLVALVLTLGVLFHLKYICKVRLSLPCYWNSGCQAAAAAAVALPVPHGDDSSYLAVCLTARDEHCDIREWVLHHASIGVGKFYIFDTQSDEPMAPVLDDLIHSGLVEYRYITNTTQGLGLVEPKEGRSTDWQGPVYTHCLREFGPRHRWIGFIDADEFIVLQEGVDSLPQLLQQNEAHAGLVLHWRMFGFDGHVERPAHGVLASYTACCPAAHSEHRHVKSIVQPQYVRKPQTPHNFLYHPGQHAVNTAGVRVDGPLIRRGGPSYKGAVLHHYASKSLVDFDVKMRRRGGAGSVKGLKHFLKWKRMCTDLCTDAVQLGQQLSRQHDLTRNTLPRCDAYVRSTA